MSVDTAAGPAAGTLDFGPTAAELAELIADPIFAKSDAAAATYSGDALTNDIRTSRPDHDGQLIAQSPTQDWIPTNRTGLPGAIWAAFSDPDAQGPNCRERQSGPRTASVLPLSRVRGPT